MSVKEHSNMEYFDLDDDYQIVVYNKDKIECEGNLELIGELMKAKGVSKNPNTKIQDEIYFKCELIVETWKSSKKS